MAMRFHPMARAMHCSWPVQGQCTVQLCRRNRDAADLAMGPSSPPPLSAHVSFFASLQGSKLPVLANLMNQKSIHLFVPIKPIQSLQSHEW